MGKAQHVTPRRRRHERRWQRDPGNVQRAGL